MYLRKFLAVVALVACVAVPDAHALIATDTIEARSIQANSIDVTKLVAGTLSATNITAGTLSSVTISGNTISGNTISGNTITGGTISSGAGVVTLGSTGIAINTGGGLVNGYHFDTNAGLFSNSAGTVLDGSATDLWLLSGTLHLSSPIIILGALAPAVNSSLCITGSTGVVYVGSPGC